MYCCANTLDPFASISRTHVSCTATTHCGLIPLLSTTNAGSSKCYRSSNNTKKLNTDSRFSQRSSGKWHRAVSTKTFRRNPISLLTREGRARFSKRYVNLYQTKHGHITEGGNTEQKTYTSTNRSTRFFSWDTVAVLVNIGQNFNVLETATNLNYI